MAKGETNSVNAPFRLQHSIRTGAGAAVRRCPADKWLSLVGGVKQTLCGCAPFGCKHALCIVVHRREIQPVGFNHWTHFHGVA